MQEHQSFDIFAWEKPKPCNLSLDDGTHDFCTQYTDTQHRVTPHEREVSTPVRFLTKKHQSVTIVEWGKQNHRQINNMIDTTEFPTLHDGKSSVVVLMEQRGFLPLVPAMQHDKFDAQSMENLETCQRSPRVERKCVIQLKLLLRKDRKENSSHRSQGKLQSSVIPTDRDMKKMETITSVTD